MIGRLRHCVCRCCLGLAVGGGTDSEAGDGEDCRGADPALALAMVMFVMVTMSAVMAFAIVTTVSQCVSTRRDDKTDGEKQGGGLFHFRLTIVVSMSQITMRRKPR